MATSNYEIKDAPNYNVIDDEKMLAQVETDKQSALKANDATYKDMIGKADTFFQDQIDAEKAWADEQTRIQNEQTDFAIEKIEQQKDQAQKDYLKEQSGAYVDWQKQSNEYGAEAEKMASAGLDKTGYAESSQVSMYNTYQMRVATARETVAKIMLGYDNDITAARLQNSAALAEIAYETQKAQLALALEGFQYKNNLILEQANKKLEIENMYHNQWTDVLAQINEENRLAEEARQFVESQKFTSEQNRLDREFKEDQAELERQHEEGMATTEYERQLELLEKDNELKNKQASSGGSTTPTRIKGYSDTKLENGGFVDQEAAVKTPANPYYPINEDSVKALQKKLGITINSKEQLEKLITNPNSGVELYQKNGKPHVRVASWADNINKVTNKYFGISFVK